MPATDGHVAVESLMATPAGEDELGTPDSDIEECGNCGGLYRKGGWHRCPDGTEVNA